MLTCNRSCKDCFTGLSAYTTITSILCNYKAFYRTSLEWLTRLGSRGSFWACVNHPLVPVSSPGEDAEDCGAVGMVTDDIHDEKRSLAAERPPEVAFPVGECLPLIKEPLPLPDR